ncbi:MAG: competence/damage-inducible protein A [Anaerolineae bacterium]|nr:competence/damage-inducible protein A [Anaerolineae bacterium]
MPSTEIIAIGTELLLGEMQDTNTRYLAQKLRNANIDLFRSTIIGDNASRISDLIKDALSRADIIITSGGLGPTVDDPTRLAVANAIGNDLVFMPELWDQIIDRLKRYGRPPTENNRRQAYIPAGSIPLENPVGTAPAFIVETGEKCIISLPGVPRELEFLMENQVMPYLVKRYQLKGVIKVLVVHTAGIGESSVDEKVADLEVLSNPTVGLLAHPAQTDVRITCKAESEEQAEKMIKTMLDEVVSRLGNDIYGFDKDTLETVIAAKLNGNINHLFIMQSGLDKQMLDRLKTGHLAEASIMDMATETLSVFEEQFLSFSEKNKISLGIFLDHNSPWPHVHVFVNNNGNKFQIERSHGGPRPNAPLWALNTGLDFLRRNI